MLNLKPSRQLNIILISVAVVLLLVCGAVYFLLSSQNRAIQAQIDAKQKELQEGKQLASRLAAIEESYRQAEAEISFLEKSLPTRAYIPTLLQQVERLAKSEHLRVVAVRPKISQVKEPTRDNPGASESGKEKKEGSGEKKARPPYDKLDIELSLSGSYFNAVNLMQKLTRFPKILSVSSFTIRSNTGRQLNASLLDITLNLEAYVLKEKPEGKGAAAGKGDTHEA